MPKGVAIDVDSNGETIVIAPIEQVDEAFIEFTRSDEYMDWLEEAHAGEADFPYNEPLLINGKEYEIDVLRVPANGFKRIGDKVEYEPSAVIES